MGCGKSNLNSVYNIQIPETCVFNTITEINDLDYLTYCNKCDCLGIHLKILHCAKCDKCHNISHYLHCEICNMCLDPHCDFNIIKHRKTHTKKIDEIIKNYVKI